MAKSNDHSNFAAVRRSIADFVADRRGNLLPLFAIMLPVMLFTLGAAIDYTSAARRQETLQGISDAAALAGTQPAMMLESCYPNSVSPSNPTQCAQVQQQVANVFNAQAASLLGVNATSITAASVSIVDSASPTTRLVTVNWSSASQNLFSGILGMPTLAISGVSTAKNSPSPAINFYMLIDTSPSMAFPATSTGVSTMVTDTPNNGNCALGCHESDVTGYKDDGMYNASGVTCQTPEAGLTSSGYTAGSKYFPCVAYSTVSVTSGNATCPNGQTCSCSGTLCYILSSSQTNYTYSSGSSATCPTLSYGSTCSCNGSGNNKKCTGTYNTPLDYQPNSSGAATSVTSNWAGPTTAVPATWPPAQSKTGGVTTSYTCESNGTQTTSVPGVTSTTQPYFGAEDAFAFSRCLGLPLRIDYVNTAVANVLSLAPATAEENNTFYAVELYTLDNNGASGPFVGLNTMYTWPVALTSIDTEGNATMTSDFAAAGAAAGTLTQLEIYKNGCLLAACNEFGDNDEDTNLDPALATLYTKMPTPGNGTSATGDTPQEVLFIISDGLNDYASGQLPSGAAAPTTCESGTGRIMSCPNQLTDPTTQVSYCQDIKNNINANGIGIRIAFLYLTYNPLNPNGFYVNNVEPFQFNGSNESGTDNVAVAAQTCASPGLYTEVNTDGDITSALAELFQKAIQTAYLSH